MNDSENNSSSIMPVAVGICLVLGVILSANLAYASLNHSSVIGCSLESGCNAVLSSNWSNWFGVPVAALSFSLYLSALLLYAATWVGIPEANKLTAKRLILTMLTMATFSAVWFIGIQLLILNQLCWICMSVHACSCIGCVIAWRSESLELRPALRVLIGSGFALLLLIIGQVAIAPEIEPDMIRVTKHEDWPAYQLFHPLEDIDTPPQRVVKLASGVIEIDTHAWPILGDPEAEQVIIELFDYRCEYCQQMSHHLDKVREQYPDLAIVTLPFPLNSNCNPHMQGDETGHEDSCFMADLAINLWLEYPEKFPEYHHWLFAGDQLKTGDEAIEHLEEMLGKAAVDKLLDDDRGSYYVDMIVDLYITNLVTTVPAIYTKHHYREGETKELDIILPTIIADHQLESAKK